MHSNFVWRYLIPAATGATVTGAELYRHTPLDGPHVVAAIAWGVIITALFAWAFRTAPDR
ncbi:hypothetical protein [Streptomyces sp. NPDC001404]|uniref:hypothetical protein n=1 Tax=Streptomyces sp. NPDC001404 TaxID=3364571 RepID=UPI003694D410